MLAWLASIFALVITYLLKDALATAFQLVTKKVTEYRANQAFLKRNDELLKKVAESQTEEERRKNVEDILNNN